MSESSFLDSFQEIVIESPVDKIIRQIRTLISEGHLKPGDKLPPERKLADKLGVSRGYIRDAIRKLEFYGILRTMPQSGTVVAGIGITALEGLMSDVLKMDNSDFASLVETRVMLEVNSARLAAERRTVDDILQIEKALHAYEKLANVGQQAVEEDLMFHLAITDASKNSVLKSLMLIITPDIINWFNKLDICSTKEKVYKAMEEHERILEHIKQQEPEQAADAMFRHLQDVQAYSLELKKD
ncbi:MAG: FadR/GntR family transcriptional regulator [Bacteroidota bacterium]